MQGEASKCSLMKQLCFQMLYAYMTMLCIHSTGATKNKNIKGKIERKASGERTGNSSSSTRRRHAVAE